MTDHAELLRALDTRCVSADDLFDRAAAAIRELVRERDAAVHERTECIVHLAKYDAILAALRREGWDDPERTLGIYDYSIHDVLRANGWCDPARYEELRALAEKGMALLAVIDPSPPHEQPKTT